MKRRTGDRINIAYSIDGFAALPAQRGELRLAARLAGAAEHLREAMNFKIEVAARRFRGNYVARLRSLLAGDQFTAAYAEGGKLDLDQSIALALRGACPDSSLASLQRF